MTLDRLKEQLAREDFLRELHHLLWLDPHMNRKKRDEGLQCRDHALVVAGIARAHGFSASAVTGSAAFIQGPRGGVAPVGFTVSPHTWLTIEGGGSFDLSPRLDGVKAFPEWQDWQVSGLVGSAFLPNGRVNYMLTRDVPTYEQAIALATHQEDRRFAIYLRQEVKPIDDEDFAKWAKWCNSPLTVRLGNVLRRERRLYPKAIGHLLDFLAGKAGSLTGLPQMKAWAAVAARTDDAALTMSGHAK